MIIIESMEIALQINIENGIWLIENFSHKIINI